MMNPNVGLRPQIILLRDGSEQAGTRMQNINAVEAVCEVLRTTLGPRGMDKLIHDGRKATISNDGAQILTLLDVVHPAAKTLVDIARAQDAEIGDGTTTVTLLAGELLKQVKQFVEDKMHPQVIIRGLREAQRRAAETLDAMAVSLDEGVGSAEARRALLEKCAKTALNSKLISRQKEFFAPMIVDAVDCLDDSLDLRMIGIKKVPGGSVTESFLVQGVAFKRTFSYAGFEQQPKSFAAPKVLLLNLELELKSERENAEVRITDPSKYQTIVDAEWRIIYEKLENCVSSGANIVLSKLPIGDLATQYFADRDIFCAGRVPDADLQRVARATGARVQTTVNGMSEEVLGTCGAFEERQVGAERYNLFTECPNASTATMVLRGGAEQFIDETHRSVHDALMIVKNCRRDSRVVSGGGAAEMEVAKALNSYALSISGKGQLIVSAFAKAMEVIPRQLADNAGFDSTDLLNELRSKHATDEDGVWFGVDIDEEGICDTMKKGVWEPVRSKINSLSSAVEAACLILSVDETVRNPRSNADGTTSGPQMGGPGGMGMGRGKPLSAAMGGRGMRGMMGGRGVRAMRGKAGK